MCSFLHSAERAKASARMPPHQPVPITAASGRSTRCSLLVVTIQLAANHLSSPVASGRSSNHPTWSSTQVTGAGPTGCPVFAGHDTARFSRGDRHKSRKVMNEKGRPRGTGPPAPPWARSSHRLLDAVRGERHAAHAYPGGVENRVGDGGGDRSD